MALEATLSSGEIVKVGDIMTSLKCCYATARNRLHLFCNGKSDEEGLYSPVKSIGKGPEEKIFLIDGKAVTHKDVMIRANCSYSTSERRVKQYFADGATQPEKVFAVVSEKKRSVRLLKYHRDGQTYTTADVTLKVAVSRDTARARLVRWEAGENTTTELFGPAIHRKRNPNAEWLALSDKDRR